MANPETCYECEDHYTEHGELHETSTGDLSGCSCMHPDIDEKLLEIDPFKEKPNWCPLGKKGNNA